MTVLLTGEAVPGWPTSGAVLDADRLHLVSRNLPGTRVAEIDLDTRTLVREVVIRAGDGAWGTTLAPDGVYVGLFGARGQGNLYRIVGGRAGVVAAIGCDYIWDLATGPDGTVYGVGGQPALVFAYSPATGRASDLGVISSSQRPRTCTVVDGRLVVGGRGGGRAFLVDRDPAGKGVRDLLPAALTLDGSVYCSAPVGDGRVVVGTEGRARRTPAIAVLDPDNRDKAVILRLPREALVDTVSVVDSVVYATARPSGALYRTDLTGRRLTRVDVPVPLSETRRLMAVPDGVVGASADGSVWRHERRTRTTTTRSAVAMSLSPQPQRAQSICASDTAVDVGGSFSVTRHPVDGGDPVTRFVPGEPKAMVRMGTTTYMAIYPTAEVWAWADGADAPVRLTRLETDQLRPIALAALTRLGALVCTTTDDASRSVVHTIDPVTGRVDVVENPLGQQSVAGLHTAASTIYVGGSGSSPGITAYDAVDGQRLWTVADAIPDGGFVLGLQVVGDRLAVSTSRGWFTTIDLQGQRVTPPIRVATVGGQLRRDGRAVLLATGDAVARIDPVSLDVTELATDLDGQFWNWPPMDIDPSGGVWVMAGRDLARIGDPR